MVKASFVYVRDAEYESQQRTVGVALKPAAGKEMFSGVNIVESEGFHGSFETERFIHGKIREIVKRSASHWNTVQSADSSKLNGNVVHSLETMHQETISETLAYRVASSATLRLLQVDRVPKALRSHIAANLLHDLGIEVGLEDYSSTATASYSRDQLLARLHLNRLVRGLGWNMNLSNVVANLSSSAQSSSLSIGADFSSERSIGMRSSSPSIKQGTTGAQSVSKDILPLVCVCIISEIAQFIADKSSGRAQISPKALHESTQASKAASTDSSSIDIRHSSHVSSRKESGFATAPIWYLQSMATGPPPLHPRWIKTQ